MKFVDWALFNQYEHSGVVDYVKTWLEKYDDRLMNNEDNFNLLTAIMSADNIRMTLEEDEELDREELKQMIYDTLAILMVLQQKEDVYNEIRKEEIVDT